MCAAGMITASTVAASAAGAPVRGASDGGVPDNFLVASSSFSTPSRGYAIGTGTCSDGRCPTLLTTANGGGAWDERSLPDKHLKFRRGVHVVAVPGEADVDSANIYLTNGKWLYATHDGGSTWSRVRLFGARKATHVGSIAVTSDRVYAIVGDGPLEGGRTRLLEGGVSAVELHGAAGVKTDGNGIDIDGGWSVVANGNYVSVALGRIFVSSAYWTSVDGETFTKAAAACTADQITALGSVDASRVTALCSFNPGMGHMFKDLKVSKDGGAFAPAGTVPDVGLTEQYVSTGPGEDTVTAIGGAAILYRSDGDGGWETPLLIDGLPFTDLQYASAKVGYVVWGGPVNHQAAIYKTTDGGHTWKVLRSLG